MDIGFPGLCIIEVLVFKFNILCVFLDLWANYTTGEYQWNTSGYNVWFQPLHTCRVRTTSDVSSYGHWVVAAARTIGEL